MTKTAIKRYVVSSLVTFVTAVCIVLLAEVDGLSLSSLKDGTIVGIGFVAIRAGIKAVLELTLSTFNK